MLSSSRDYIILIMTINDISNYLTEQGADQSKISGSEYAYSYRSISYALTENAKVPKLHLLCQSELAKILQNDFESVQPSSKMDPKTWVEILLAGQLSDEQIYSLIDLAYEQAKDL